MATSRRESQPNATRTINNNNNRSVRNMSPVQKKPSESEQGLLRRARSVPSSPDRRSSSSASTAASSSSSAAANAGRPSSSFNPRTASSTSSRSTSGSASSSSSSSAHGHHGKSATTLLHSVSAVVGAKQAAGVIRRRADKSVWPHALTTKDPASSKAAAKSPSSSSSNVQRSKLSTMPGAEKTAAVASSPKPKTKKTQAAAASTSSMAARISPRATAKRRTAALETSAAAAPSIQRTTSVPAAPKAEQQVDVELLMEEFDEMESISTPSIEEHLQQRLPDPVDITTYATSSSSEERKDGRRQEAITEHVFSEEKHDQGLDRGNCAGDTAGGIDSGVAVVVEKEAVGETDELLEEEDIVVNEGARDAAGLKKDSPVDEAELNETVVGDIELKGAVDDETKLNEADGGTAELKDPGLVVAVNKEDDKADEERIILLPATTKTPAERWRKDDGIRSNEVTEEEGRSKTSTTPMQERRKKVMALVGKFETAMSARE